MNTIVPREISHVFEMVVKARRFSILPRAFEAESPQSEMHQYLIACKSLLKESNDATVVGMKWFHDNPRFTEEHVGMEAKLNSAFVRCTISDGRLKKDVDIEELEFLWKREGLQGIFRCAVLMEFKSTPKSFVSLFEASTGPFVVQGANDWLRAAISRAKKIVESNGSLVLLIRGDEVEVYAKDDLLAELFVQAYGVCRE